MSRADRTFSCLKKHSILISLNTRLLEIKFWKTLGIFLSATLFPSRGSVTDLYVQEDKQTHKQTELEIRHMHSITLVTLTRIAWET